MHYGCAIELVVISGRRTLTGVIVAKKAVLNNSLPLNAIHVHRTAIRGRISLKLAALKYISYQLCGNERDSSSERGRIVFELCTIEIDFSRVSDRQCPPVGQGDVIDENRCPENVDL